MDQSGPIVFFVGRYSFYNRYSGYLFLFEWVLFISFFQGTGSFELQSVHFSHSFVSDSLQPHALKHARLPCPPPTPRACSISCPSSWWSHLIILSFIVLFSSCLQSFPASGYFPMSQFFASGGQRNWLDLFGVQRTLRSLLQHHISKAPILRHSAFFIVQFSHPYMPTGKSMFPIILR